MENALRIGQMIASIVVGACLGFLPFWQWLTLGYATGWTLLISAVSVAAFVVYYLMDLQHRLSDKLMSNSAGIGMMFSFFVLFGCLISSNIIHKDETILVPLEDGSKGIVQLEGDRYYSPFGPTYETLGVTSDRTIVMFQMMCDDGELCYYRSSGRFEVSQGFVMSTIVVDQTDRFEYRDIVRNAILETIIADRPDNVFDLEDGAQKRINQRLGLTEDAPCPIELRLHLDIEDNMADFRRSY
ncbi:MAG: hypothetical protein CMF62_05345 [Magnetococcales bacterium]|nr:hypothetical protein [Magnetococcales bacterium]